MGLKSIQVIADLGEAGVVTSRPLRVFDVFSGLGGWSQAAKAHGHQVIHLDWEPSFGAELTMDVLEFVKEPQRYLNEAALKLGYIKQGEDWIPDLILLSPDCRGFSVASIGVMWETPYPPIPKHDTARLGMKLARAALDILAFYPEALYAIENPRGMMTNVFRFWNNWEPDWITYCRYGMDYQKPTRIWHNIPGLKLRPSCDSHPETGGWETDEQGVEWTLDRFGGRCHQRAERGSEKGVQGLEDAETRSIVPYQLSEQVLRAALGLPDLDNGRKSIPDFEAVDSWV